jgi:hypothetical protein
MTMIMIVRRRFDYIDRMHVPEVWLEFQVNFLLIALC